jgi:hypothetical protein
MSGAYDRVVPLQLLHNLRKRCLPQWIVKFISSFLTDRSTSLTLPGFSSPHLSTDSGSHQGSNLSPFLYLFYNADLVDLCNSLDLPTTCIGFVDDMNILAFGMSTEETCTSLNEIHICCLRCAKMHWASFAPEKYALVHFPKKKRQIPTTPLHLATTSLHPSPHARVLGLILDSKLSCHPHFSFIKSKFCTQTFAVTRQTSSIWGAAFKSCHLLYTSIARPAITYASYMWHLSLGTPYARKYVVKDRMVLQYMCLRAVSSAYEATPIRNLEVEVRVPLLGSHLDSL